MRNKRFEAWFARRIGVSQGEVAQMFDGTTYTSREYYVELAWAAWCEALGFEGAPQ